MILIHYCPKCAATFEDATIQECTDCHGKVTHFELAVPEDALQEQARLSEQDAAEKNYTAAMRNMVRGVWKGVFDIDDAFDIGFSSIQLFLTQAWNAGLQSVGVLPSEQSPQQRRELRNIISGELTHLEKFLIDVEAGSEAKGGKLAPQMKRANTWALRAQDVENRARVTAQTDPKLKWTLGSAEHCSTCLKLSNKTKRASTWKRRGIMPKNPENFSLACRGWNCACALVPTTEPLSRGPLPKVP